MLTKRQHELLTFIAGSELCPSYDEMRIWLRLKSKSGVHRLIAELEERGFIRRLPFRARAIEVIKMPDGTLPLEREQAVNRLGDVAWAVAFDGASKAKLRTALRDFYAITPQHQKKLKGIRLVFKKDLQDILA